jgi:hypothetical protein
MNAVHDLQNNIEVLAISWGESLKLGDHRNVNKYNNAITKIVKPFKKDKDLGKLVLVPLLKHPDPSVRLLTSVHALDLGIHIQESEDVLVKIANDPDIHVIRLMAQINLSIWNKKKQTISE